MLSFDEHNYCFHLLDAIRYRWEYSWFISYAKMPTTLRETQGDLRQWVSMEVAEMPSKLLMNLRRNTGMSTATTQWPVMSIINGVREYGSVLHNSFMVARFDQYHEERYKHENRLYLSGMNGFGRYLPHW